MSRRRPLADVTLVTQYFRPERGAAQVRLGSIVDELVRRGLDVNVVAALPNYPTGRIFEGWPHRPLQTRSENGSTVHRVWVYAAMGDGVRRMLNYLSFGVMSVLGLLQACRGRRVVVEYPTLPGAIPAVLLARLRRQTVVVLVADLWVDSIAELGALGSGWVIRFLRRSERWMLCRAHAVTAVTEGVRDALIEKGVDPSRIVWLPNGADTMMFSPGPPREDIVERYGGQPGESMFLYAGTHGYVHGLEVLLDAAALLAGEPVRIVFVGDGSEKDALKQRSADLALDNVTFLDPVSPAEVADLLRCATGALVSVRGGDVYRTIRSAKAIPAMSSGRPVIYSGDDEGSSLIEEIGAGLVTPPGDPEAVAAAIRLLMAEPGLRDALGSKGRSWVVAHASWQQLVGDWLEQLNRLDQPSGLAGGLR